MAAAPGSARPPDVCAAVLESLPAHTAVLDAAGRIIAVNRAWRRFCADNGGDEQLCGIGADYLGVCDSSGGGAARDARAVAAGIRKVIAGDVEQFTMDYECSSPMEERWFQVTVVALRAPDLPGEVWQPPAAAEPRLETDRIGAVVSHSNITARKQDELELVHEATHDPLTGLANRALLLGELRRELHRAHTEGTPIALLYLDLDGFKTVNDMLGHDAGDRLLRATADRLRSVLRPEAHLARVGGDEFVALLPATNLGAARRTARRLSRVTREPVELDGLPVEVSGSIGVAVSDGGPTTAEELLAGADAAMYRAKRRGRARTEVFTGQLRARTQRRAQVEAQLEQALDDGSLQLFLQPVVSLLDGSVLAGEALVRWFPRQGGLRSADGFLDEVTHTRVRSTITRSVLSAATGRLATHGTTTVGVNVGLSDLRGGSLVHEVSHALQSSGCPPELLRMEISEQAVVAADQAVRRTVTGLRSLGVGVAIDHVSGGVAPALMASLAPDEVKLDRTLVPVLLRTDVQAVVRALVTLAAGTGSMLTAVGVESAQQRRQLVALGIVRGQGWQLGPPAPWVTVGRQRAETARSAGARPDGRADLPHRGVGD